MKLNKQLLKTTLTFLISIGLNATHAQNFEWAKSFGANLPDRGLTNAVDNFGNLYIMGRFQGTVDFDPGAGTFSLTSAGNFDVFVKKLNANGNFLWAKSFGGSIWDESYCMALDASGNVYITGFFGGTVDFDPGPGTANLTSTGDWDVFIQKLNASGNFLWAKSFGGSADDRGKSIAVDASGNVVTTGWFQGTVDFDPGAGAANLSSAGFSDIFVQKLDASGNFQWARSFGSGFYDNGEFIAIDASGNIYATGNFQATVDFDPGAGTANLSSAGSFDVFVQKLNASGNYIWAKRFGGNNYDYVNSIEVDAPGNVFTTGFFQGTVDFNPGSGIANLTSVGVEDIFVQKLDASGNFQWARSFGSGQDDMGNSIAVDASGNVYTTGYFRGTVDFNPGTGTANLSSAGGGDVFVQKLDPSGNFQWARSFGGFSPDKGQSITTDAFGNVYTTGFFDGTVDFDPGAGTANLSSAGSGDVFVHKMSQGGVTGLVEVAKGIQVKAFPNPSEGLVELTFEQAMNDVEIRVTDLQGKIVFTKALDAVTDEQINIAGPSGIYFLSVKTPKGQSVVKLVKE